MKFRLLLFALLFVARSAAQDYKLIEEMKHVPNKARATEIAEQLVATANGKFRLYTTKESYNAGILRFRFVQSELSDNDLKNGNFTEAQRQAFITIDFSFYNAGEDVNAPRPESVTYKLNEITAAYDDLFPIWKTFFKPHAEYELAKTDARSQYLKDAEKRIDIYIFHAESGWALRNLSTL
ncbi:hypothetical protein HYN48_10350 [Flavobacterium magnum]|uniref:Uncharacterized protein n=1 Tax=Flavobacterium magnum TaxID=2162713 RepID=A0A2S0RFL4_9FLAO|nr:hypothetical protein [Flavobacterium magnum]AWA30454.1 hypothetical protein HYN48_10350 [Flavobacterium magnum]